MLSGRVGESKGDTMYHWVEDRDFLKRAYGVCADLVNQLVQNLKNYGIEARMNVVGSKKRNMSTQNAKEPIDFDFNLLIVNSADYSNGRVLKENVRKAFNEVLSDNGWGDCDDSTSALTTEQRVFNQGNKTPFYIDVCIVKQDRYGLHRLIHQKTGFVDTDQWYWNQVPNSQELLKKEEALKPDYWPLVRETYLKKKNMYLTRQEERASFKCYIEAVNEVYDKVRWGNL
jgi:hypothetical protein